MRHIFPENVSCGSFWARRYRSSPDLTRSFFIRCPAPCKQLRDPPLPAPTPPALLPRQASRPPRHRVSPHSISCRLLWMHCISAILLKHHRGPRDWYPSRASRNASRKRGPRWRSETGKRGYKQSSTRWRSSGRPMPSSTRRSASSKASRTWVCEEAGRGRARSHVQCPQGRQGSSEANVANRRVGVSNSFSTTHSIRAADGLSGV